MFDPQTIAWLLRSVDIIAVLFLVYLMLSLSRDRRVLMMLRGVVVLLVANVLSFRLGLVLVHFVLDKMLAGAAVAIAIILQPELRRFLEQLGRGQMLTLLKAPAVRPYNHLDSFIQELADAVIELSQNRCGALLVMETGEPIAENEFSVPGVPLNALISKELIQTIFQVSTLLHDGALWVRGDRLVAAGVILPLSDRAASREIGTRHRAAMGITERVSQCFCVVVSEETGSIAIAEGGKLERPLTGTRLRELLESRLQPYTAVSLSRTVPKFSWLWQRLDPRHLFVKK
ncbi:MAG: TIGR00159 family protein [Oscillatoriales cyanobacterium SM2_2_1]|nr:TIGR00159 family protein [Oscillatoriales cyanobacterium SM2_2_1]